MVLESENASSQQNKVAKANEVIEEKTVHGFSYPKTHYIATEYIGKREETEDAIMLNEDKVERESKDKD